ncbi:MAG: hypothetical protein Q4D38_02550 [Planctomycetia bacterium]|nr:hypothetical protein [Planctomycetia bacterium]
MINRIWNDESGVLTFEWILLITLLVIGIVGGLAAVRDAYIYELGSVAAAIGAVDTSYFVQSPFEVTTTLGTTATLSGNAVGWTNESDHLVVGARASTTVLKYTTTKDVTTQTQTYPTAGTGG